MGDKSFMLEQIDEKLDSGFKCIKMKIGAIDFESEIELLKSIRNRYSSDVIEIRVDANGAFRPEEALDKLHQLAEFDLHSIEQPIKQGQFDAMANLCSKTPLPIALDEELIGIHGRQDRIEMLDQISPQFIILKPSLVGGFASSDEWISLAKERDIGWWATSALESNIGLNAIYQWTLSKETSMYQGLGTGSLYTNNFESPLVIQNASLGFESSIDWEEPNF